MFRASATATTSVGTPSTVLEHRSNNRSTGPTTDEGGRTGAQVQQQELQLHQFWQEQIQCIDKVDPIVQQQVQQQELQLHQFWQEQIQCTDEFKTLELPLARVKKIMKSDEEVRMISSAAPAVFAKACEIFILELTLRAWMHTEENKRRTLQRNDIATAISKSDLLDFLIDIVPREELKASRKVCIICAIL